MGVTVYGSDSFTTVGKGRTTRSQSQGSTQTEPVFCLAPSCNAEVDDNSQALQCSNCNGFCHCDCLKGMTPELYLALSNAPENPLFFMCDSCISEQKTKQAPINEKISKLNTQILANNQAITQLSKKLSYLSEGGRTFQRQLTVPSFQVIQKLQQEVETEEKEIEKRKTSCVIYNLKEDISTFIPKLCEELNISESDITLTETIKNAKRDVKPVKLKVATEAIKWHIVGKIRTRFQTANLYAKPDMTPKQAAEEKVLVARLSALRAKQDGATYKIKNYKVVSIDSNGKAHPVECE